MIGWNLSTFFVLLIMMGWSVRIMIITPLVCQPGGWVAYVVFFLRGSPPLHDKEHVDVSYCLFLLGYVGSLYMPNFGCVGVGWVFSPLYTKGVPPLVVL